MTATSTSTNTITSKLLLSTARGVLVTETQRVSNGRIHTALLHQPDRTWRVVKDVVGNSAQQESLDCVFALRSEHHDIGVL